MLVGWPGTVLEILAGIHHTTMFPIFSTLCTVIFLYLFITDYWYISAIYLAWWFCDRDTPRLAGRPLEFYRNLAIWKYLARYFPIRLHKTVDLDPSRNYIFAYHPHGVLLFGGFVNFGTNATGFDEKFPGITVYLLALNDHFRAPLYREHAMAGGLASVDSESVDFKLRKMGPGHSVFIAPGGTKEIIMYDPNSYTLKILGRKGFIRKSLKNGAPVVPVFSFNEHRLYDISPVRPHSFIYYWDAVVSKILGFEITYNAAGYYPFSIFLPKRRIVNTVVGAPIDFNALKSFESGQDPPEDIVGECHQIYLEALTQLYDDNKARFNDYNTPLIFT